ncbi:MAG: hypothetical protein HY235_30120 [Acidobacteria bacterium]|nr:hypothetical protein [Acidobacteriota bacterium]
MSAQLPVPLQPSAQPHWCWAAVSEAVAAFYANPAGWTQCRVASSLLGADCCQNPPGCNIPHRLELALRFIGHLSHFDFGPAPFAAVRTQILNRLPVCAFIAWRGGGPGHFVIISGFEDQTDAILTIEDPLFGPSLCAFDEFVSNYLQRGVWSATYFTVPGGVS